LVPQRPNSEKNKKMKMDWPNRKNVELGDLLVLTCRNFVENLGIYPIVEIGGKEVTARTSTGVKFKRKYQEAVVLKENGTYLIGKNCGKELDRSREATSD